MQSEPVETAEIKAEELQEILEQVRTTLGETAYSKLDRLMRAYLAMQQLVQSGRISIDRLRRIIFGPKSEKSSDVFKKEQSGKSSNIGRLSCRDRTFTS